MRETDEKASHQCQIFGISEGVHQSRARVPHWVLCTILRRCCKCCGLVAITNLAYYNNLSTYLQMPEGSLPGADQEIF